MNNKLCVAKEYICNVTTFDGTNYYDIYRMCPRSEVVFADGERMPLKTWAIELCGFSPFDAGPEYINIQCYQANQLNTAFNLFKGEILISEPAATQATKCQSDEFEKFYLRLPIVETVD